jgi:hypothetical protein
MLLTDENMAVASFILSGLSFAVVILVAAYRYVKTGNYALIPGSIENTHISEIPVVACCIAMGAFFVCEIVLNVINFILDKNPIAISFVSALIFMAVVYFTAKRLRKPYAFVEKLKGE